MDIVNNYSTPNKYSNYSRTSNSYTTIANLKKSHSESMFSCSNESNYLKHIDMCGQKRNQPMLFVSTYFPSVVETRLIDRISFNSTKIKKLDYENRPSIRFCNGNFHSPRIVKPVSISMLKQGLSLTKNPEKKPTEIKSKEFDRRINLNIVLDKFIDPKKLPVEEKRTVVPCVAQCYELTKIVQSKAPIKIIVEHKGTLKTKSTKEIIEEYKKLSHREEV